MKWIKTFEELTPNIYRRAGQDLMYIPHKKDRGRKLKDYGSEKEWGIFNIDYVKNYSTLTRAGKFTRPAAKFILNKRIPANRLTDITYENITIEEAVDMWRDGERSLQFCIQFYFEATEETKHEKDISGEIPMFSFVVNLSSWTDSLEIYNEPEDPDDEDYMSYFKIYTLEELYEETSDVNISLKVPQVDAQRNWSPHSGGYQNNFYYGVFSDRNSAFRFKKLLPNLIDDGITEKIWELFSLLGDSDNFKRCIHALKYGIKINHLYDDVKVLSGTTDYQSPSKWFHYSIADTNLPKKKELINNPIDSAEPKEEPKEPKEEPKVTWYQSRT
jgi:hypothetical protein